MPDQTERSRQSVLIVEDEPLTRLALVYLLSQLGYATVPVATIAEGLERLDGQQCAILDLNLPDGLGTHVLQRIRDAGRPIRVAVTTGTSDLELLDDCRRLRAELVLQKPIDVNALLRWLKTDLDIPTPAATV